MSRYRPASSGPQPQHPATEGKKRAALERGWKPGNLVSISGAYFESPRRYLLSLYFQGRAPLTLTTAYSMHCRPFSIACCLPSDAPAAALAGRWQRGSRQGWEWVWASGKGWSGWARPRWDATLKVLTENIRPPPWPVKALTWPFMRLQAHMTFPAMRPIRQVPVPLPTIPLASCPGSSHGLRM